MSATGLEVFDRTLHTTNIWLDDIMKDTGTDRRVAWHALGAVLRSLRNRLPINLAVNFGVQLPLLIRGAYYERWNPEENPETIRHQETFLQQIEEELAKTDDVNTPRTVQAVLATVSKHMDPGQIEKVKNALPKEIQTLW